MSLHVHVDLQTHMPFLLMPSLKSNFCLKLHCKPLIIFVESRHQSAGGIESRFTGNVCRGCWHSRRLVAGRVSESRAETTAWWRLVVQVQGTPEDREGKRGPHRNRGHIQINSRMYEISPGRRESRAYSKQYSCASGPMAAAQYIEIRRQHVVKRR
jgi:hypothetical protein